MVSDNFNAHQLQACDAHQLTSANSSKLTMLTSSICTFGDIYKVAALQKI